MLVVFLAAAAHSFRPIATDVPRIQRAIKASARLEPLLERLQSDIDQAQSITLLTPDQLRLTIADTQVIYHKTPDAVTRTTLPISAPISAIAPVVAPAIPADPNAPLTLPDAPVTDDPNTSTSPNTTDPRIDHRTYPLIDAHLHWQTLLRNEIPYALEVHSAVNIPALDAATQRLKNTQLFFLNTDHRKAMSPKTDSSQPPERPQP